MKKNHSFVAAFFFIVVTIATTFSLYIPKSFATSEDIVTIPNEAIRLRILANSNSERDQRIKREIRDVVNEQISEWVQDLTSFEQARSVIIDHLDEIEALSLSVLEKENVHQPLEVDFGPVQFPTKLYGQFLYPAGTYEAVRITIGEGKGANWWCVLFPPLCFLDFSTGTAVQDDSDGSQSTTLEGERKKDQSKKDTKEGNNHFVEDTEKEPKVKFFIIEIFEKIISFFT
ncbi:stage II sporulation protein R [Fervidibacillus halotolerans]|uniref:Stage II sporulation protein R n=1 Tax=Fervidibacillus halotolerans TaxID=2980027 RepID=A0A9E8M0R3_9BACI|nr:stage II sporulation protein R [Fervidibacillus halotolerans]WAA12189.1 stage II sporulation protein R [Fervidibacillus halotolerans]